MQENPLFKKTIQSAINIFEPKTKRLTIDSEEKIIKEALRKRDLFVYSLKAEASKHFSLRIDQKYEPFLAEADQQLTNAYESYVNGSYKAPLKLKIISEDNYGI